LNFVYLVFGPARWNAAVSGSAEGGIPLGKFKISIFEF